MGCQRGAGAREGGGAHIIRILLEELLTRGGELVRELVEAGGGERHDGVCVRFVRVVAGRLFTGGVAESI